MKKAKARTDFEWPELASQVAALEKAGLVTRTFRRLDPERQNAVIEAIVEEAADAGPAQMNIKRVASRAGVSVGSLYQYFGNRERMLDFAVELCRGYLVTTVEASREHLVPLPLRAGLEYYVLAGCDWASHQAGVMRLYARAAYHGEPSLQERLVKPVALAMRGVVRAMLEAAAERGEIGAGQNLDALANVVHALTVVLGDARMLPHLDAYLLLSEKASAEQTLQAALGLVLQGLEGEGRAGRRGASRRRA